VSHGARSELQLADLRVEFAPFDSGALHPSAGAAGILHDDDTPARYVVLLWEGERSCHDIASQIYRLGGGFIHVNLRGEDAGQVLQKSSPYDFHPRNFPPGRCAQTVFAKATALVAAREDGAFDIVFRRSFADYLMQWLADAAAEYGYRLAGWNEP